jgi:hypothetical protein
MRIKGSLPRRQLAILPLADVAASSAFRLGRLSLAHARKPIELTSAASHKIRACLPPANRRHGLLLITALEPLPLS